MTNGLQPSAYLYQLSASGRPAPRNGWCKISFFDIIEGIQKIIMVREVCRVGRNDACFCGSGHKQKKCHPDIYEKSVMANLLQVYHQLDEETKAVSDSLCKKGCCDCCTDDFEVSVVEFFTILQHLQIKASPERISQYFDAAQQRNFSPSGAPCIFLDENDKGCTIYEVRPTLCRCYGSYQGITRCDKIRANANATQGLLSHWEAEIWNNIDCFDTPKGPCESTPKPIVYWFSSLAKQNARRFQDLQRAAKDSSLSEYIRIMTL